MQYQLKMLGNLRDFLPISGQYSQCEMPLPTDHSVSAAVAGFSLPDTRPYFVMLNGDKLQPDRYDSTLLSDGDEMVLFPPIKGG